ncbi:hypothetical protein [Gracilibacillus alcaliphilus]|nr:hypothetical protein [Gracilibacillus alcaliphilus]MBM7679076.1 hypothetical protein [Gracilibacillus alcaliphilus]
MIYGQRKVENWENIVQVAAGGDHTVGMKKAADFPRASTHCTNI